MEYIIRVKEEKCASFKDKVKSLGHQISPERLHKEFKLSKLLLLHDPANTQELRSFLGKFVPDLATLVLTSTTVLPHYNKKYTLHLAADASSYELGAVISHVFPSGVEKFIAYASRTLTPSERNYSQLEKEVLSLVFAVQKISLVFAWV